MSSIDNGTVSGGGDGRGSSRLYNKLMETIEAKKYYEAHQLSKTLSFRYRTGKKFTELEELLYKVAFFLLENGQIESGGDVCVMLSKLYLQSEGILSPSEARATRLLNLLQRLPSSSTERPKYIADITEWIEDNEIVSGKFHLAVSKMYIAEHSYSDAWRHLIRSNDGAEAATLTRQIIIETFIRRDELDLVIAMLVIGFLTLKRTKEAEVAYRALVKVEDFPELSPLLNGVRFLVEAAKMNNPDTFTQIKDVYEPSFSREPHLRKMVLSAGKALFNLSERSGGPFGGGGPMPMQMMMNAFLAQDQSSLD